MSEESVHSEEHKVEIQDKLDGKSDFLENLENKKSAEENEIKQRHISKKTSLQDVFYYYCNIKTAAFQPITSTIYDRILLSQIDTWFDKIKLIGRSNSTFTLTETGYQFLKFR